ncbi:MAG TPA: isochorismatase family cysteine hydrolase [Candidatus Krumholzibacteriaceae bacterium]|nr:isochorismatase family cysteine hydrolase [Candidatus Krumholzibacteriaceae bacterium]
MPSLIPEETALLILDMQRFFLDPASHAFIRDAGSIIPGLNRLAREFMKNNLPVVVTRHLNTEENACSMARWWNDMITEDNPMSRIIPEFRLQGAKRLVKTQYDAFLNTDLENYFTDKGAKQIVIGGVMTHLCCETTARAAFTRGFDIFFLADGTATYSMEHQRAALLNISHGFGCPVLVKEVLAGLVKDDKDQGGFNE